jgi:hypothetical protein
MGSNLVFSNNINKIMSQALNVNNTGFGNARMIFNDSITGVPLFDFILPAAENNIIHSIEGFIIFGLGDGITTVAYNTNSGEATGISFEIRAQNDSIVLTGAAGIYSGNDIRFYNRSDWGGYFIKTGQQITLKKLVYKHYQIGANIVS